MSIAVLPIYMHRGHRLRATHFYQLAISRSFCIAIFWILPVLSPTARAVFHCTIGAAASNDLQQHFSMSKEQAEGVLNMSLRRLTSLESARLQEEAQQLTDRCFSLPKQYYTVACLNSVTKQYTTMNDARLVMHTVKLDKAIRTTPCVYVASGWIQLMHLGNHCPQGSPQEYVVDLVNCIARPDN